MNAIWHAALQFKVSSDKPQAVEHTVDAIQLGISVATCTEKSILIRIFEMIWIFIRKSANGTEIQR